MIEPIHQHQPVATLGPALADADAAMVLLHGRGATAPSILTLAEAWPPVPGMAYLAPQAAHHTWYPYSFLAPIPQNEPWLSSALQAVAEVVAKIEAAGIPSERTFLLGFSQGACLALEYAARHAARYGGLIGLSGGLIGPPGTPRKEGGDFEGTPVFLGCSDADPHIPAARVQETAEVLERLGAAVTMRLYAGMGHTVIPDEIQAVAAILTGQPVP